MQELTLTWTNIQLGLDSFSEGDLGRMGRPLSNAGKGKGRKPSNLIRLSLQTSANKRRVALLVTGDLASAGILAVDTSRNLMPEDIHCDVNSQKILPQSRGRQLPRRQVSSFGHACCGLPTQSLHHFSLQAHLQDPERHAMACPGLTRLSWLRLLAQAPATPCRGHRSFCLKSLHFEHEGVRFTVSMLFRADIVGKKSANQGGQPSRLLRGGLRHHAAAVHELCEGLENLRSSAERILRSSKDQTRITTVEALWVIAWP